MTRQNRSTRQNPDRSPRSVRDHAADILARVDSGAFADPLLQTARRTARFDPRDRNLLQEIVLGSLSRRRSIDHVLTVYANRPTSQIDPHVLNLLRSAVYQIRYLDRVPAYAVVSESVDIARKRTNIGAARFVNAVLRGVAENRKTVRTPDAASDPAGYLALTESYPDWMVQRWVNRWGLHRAKQLCAAGNARQHLNIRVNTGRTDTERLAVALADEGITVRFSASLPNCLSVQDVETLFSSDAYQAGHFFVQGTGAARVTQLFDVQPGEHILDVCAAPGGKACAASLAVGPGGSVTALDNRPARVAVIRENTRRLHVTCHTLVADARSLPLAGTFDRVLVDAPCSALGIIAGHPEIKWHRTEEDIPRMAEQQQVLLRTAASAVRVGGHLLYSTCTTEPEENEDVVTEFLRDHHSFAIVPARSIVDDPDSEETLRVWPGEDGSDGAFAALLVRRR